MPANIYKVPVNTDPNATLRVSIPVDGENLYFELEFNYNSEAQYWTMTIRNANTGSTYISKIPLLTKIGSNANILKQYSYLKIGSVYVAPTQQDSRFLSPNDTNLGVDYILLWGDTEA